MNSFWLSIDHLLKLSWSADAGLPKYLTSENKKDALQLLLIRSYMNQDNSRKKIAREQ